MSENDGLSVVGSLDLAKGADGNEIVLQPLRLSDYGAARDASLAFYRRDKLKMYAENQDLLGSALLEKKAEELSEVTYDQLPSMPVHEYFDDSVYDLPVDQREVKKIHNMEYALWWMASNPEGMLFMLWLSAKREPSQSRWSRGDVEGKFLSADGAIDAAKLERAAVQLGELSKPKLSGNGIAQDDGAGKKRRRESREKRRKRRANRTGR